MRYDRASTQQTLDEMRGGTGRETREVKVKALDQSIMVVDLKGPAASSEPTSHLIKKMRWERQSTHQVYLSYNVDFPKFVNELNSCKGSVCWTVWIGDSVSGHITSEMAVITLIILNLSRFPKLCGCSSGLPTGRENQGSQLPIFVLRCCLVC